MQDIRSELNHQVPIAPIEGVAISRYPGVPHLDMCYQVSKNHVRSSRDDPIQNEPKLKILMLKISFFFFDKSFNTLKCNSENNTYNYDHLLAQYQLLICPIIRYFAMLMS